MPETEVGLDPGAEVLRACHEPIIDAWSELQTEWSTGLIETVRRGVARHSEVVTALGLDADPPDEWEERADRLLDYRRAVDSELLEPLARAWERLGPATSIEQALGSALEECSTRCGELAVESAAVWADGALARKPSDGLRRRLGKFFARGLSAARKVGEERSVPLRNVAQQHLTAVVAPRQDDAAMQAALSWAAWARDLDIAWTEWGDAAMLALVRAELPESEDDEAQELWESIRQSAQQLQARLEALARDHPAEEVAGSGRAPLDAARSVLDADLAVAGSFLLRPREVVPPPALPRFSKAVPGLRDWDEGVGGRMQVYRSLLSILSGATAVQRRLVWRVRDRCLSKMADLIEAASRLEDIHTDLLKDPPHAPLEERLSGLPSPVEAALEPALEAIPAPSFVDSAISEVSDSTVEALLAVVRQAPGTLRLHAPDAKLPTGAGKPDTRLLELQELARQSFDALRIERIRSSTADMVLAIDESRADVSGLPEVFSFAHDEALRELEGGGPEAEQRATDLVTGALRSMSESLRSQVTELELGVGEAQVRLATEITDGSLALLDRLRAGRMQAQLLAARSRVADLLGWVRDAAGPPVRRARERMTVAWSRARGFLLGLLRARRALVGAAPAEGEASTRSVRTLADARAVTEGLPLVYQRLFTLQPLSESALLVGRTSDLETGMQRWEQWRTQGVPLLIRGRQGSGVTSFINVLRTAIEEEGGSVASITLDSRIADEAELAKLLAELLGMPPCDSLDDLAAAVFAVGKDSLPSAVSVDNLEHVYLRVPRGTDLLERLLTLMAETEPRIFWIGGVATSAWQLVAAAEPTAVSQVEVFDLQPLGAAAIREAIEVRHRRSGLEVTYAEPSAAKHRLRRRFQHLRDARRHRSLVEDDFFDRLYRTSDGYLGLALFQWLLSADFESGNGVVMRHPERPDFSVLEALDLTQNFTLKAFLEHRTLTLAEHDRIFRLPRHESYQILESLRNRHLIEAVATEASRRPDRSEIEEDLSYRVRPLLTGAVISHLRGRNIVH